jgi:small subunit ribosomal protein S11
MAKKRKSTNKRTTHKKVSKGRIYVNATFNNTIVTITDDKGNVLCWSSTGKSGFFGSRKSTPYAASITIENAINEAKKYGLSEVDIYIKGPGNGRATVLRVIKSQRLKVNMIADVTPVPHNGTRPRKAKHNR